MSRIGRIHVFIVESLAIVIAAHVVHAQTPQPAQPAKPVEPAKPAETSKPSAAPGAGTALKLTGLTMTVPQAWVEEKV